MEDPSDSNKLEDNEEAAFKKPNIKETSDSAKQSSVEARNAIAATRRVLAKVSFFSPSKDVPCIMI